MYPLHITFVYSYMSTMITSMYMHVYNIALCNNETQKHTACGDDKGMLSIVIYITFIYFV